jgi:hypothetical protein
MPLSPGAKAGASFADGAMGAGDGAASEAGPARASAAIGRHAAEAVARLAHAKKNLGALLTAVATAFSPAAASPTQDPKRVLVPAAAASACLAAFFCPPPPPAAAASGSVAAAEGKEGEESGSPGFLRLLSASLRPVSTPAPAPSSAASPLLLVSDVLALVLDRVAPASSSSSSSSSSSAAAAASAAVSAPSPSVVHPSDASDRSRLTAVAYSMQPSLSASAAAGGSARNTLCVTVSGPRKAVVVAGTHPEALAMAAMASCARAIVEAATDAHVTVMPPASLPLAGAAVVGCKRSTVVLPPCAGHVLLDGLELCIVYAAARDVTARNCVDCTLHLYSEHRPVFVADNRQVKLAPYSAVFPSLTARLSTAGLSCAAVVEEFVAGAASSPQADEHGSGSDGKEPEESKTKDSPSLGPSTGPSRRRGSGSSSRRSSISSLVKARLTPAEAAAVGAWAVPDPSLLFEKWRHPLVLTSKQPASSSTSSGSPSAVLTTSLVEAAAGVASADEQPLPLDLLREATVASAALASAAAAPSESSAVYTIVPPSGFQLRAAVDLSSDAAAPGCGVGAAAALALSAAAASTQKDGRATDMLAALPATVPLPPEYVLSLKARASNVMALGSVIQGMASAPGATTDGLAAAQTVIMSAFNAWLSADPQRLHKHTEAVSAVPTAPMHP